MDYTGADTYITQPAAAVPLQADFIPFHSVTGTAVKKVTFGDIQASTLSLVDASITTANANVIENETATPPSQSFNSVAPVQRVVTLLDSEYATLVSNATTLGNTLYLTTATAATQYTKTLSVSNSVSGFSNGSLTGSQNNDTLTGVENSNWSFTTGVSANSGYTYSGNAPVTISGTFDSDSTVTSTITGSITADPVPGNVSDTLVAITDSIGDGTGYTITSNSPLSGTEGDSFSTSAFGVTATLDTNYEFTTAQATSYNQATSYYGDDNTTATITGDVGLITYNVTYSVDTSGITNDSPAGYTLVPGDSFSGLVQGAPGVTISSGGSVTASVQVIPIDGTANITASTTVNPVTADQNIVLSPTGTINANTGTATLTLDTSGIGGSNEWTPSKKYQINSGALFDYNGVLTDAGSSTATFTADIVANSGYFVSGKNVNYSPSQTVTFSNNSTVTATLTGTVYRNRQNFSYGAGAYKCGNTINSSGGIVKTSGGSASYVENGDTVYTSTSSSTLLANGNYTGNINNVTNPSSGGFSVSSGIVSGVTSCP